MTGTAIINVLDTVRSEIRLHTVHFWGQPSRIRGVLLPMVYGDGQQLMWLQPLATRPNFYLFYGHSGWKMDNCAKGDVFCDHLDEVEQDIEDHFGQHYETFCDSLGRERHRYNWWPALDDSCGMQWGNYR